MILRRFTIETKGGCILHIQESAQPDEVIIELEGPETTFHAILTESAFRELCQLSDYLSPDRIRFQYGPTET